MVRPPTDAPQAHPRARRGRSPSRSWDPGPPLTGALTPPDTHSLVQGRGEIVHVASCGRGERTGLRGTARAKVGATFHRARDQGQLRPLFLIPSPNRVPSPGKVPIGFPILPQPPRPFSSSCLGPAHSVLGPPLNPASHLGGWMLPGCSIYPPTSVCAQDTPLRPRPAPPTDSASAEPLAPPHNLPVPTRVRSLAPPLPRGSPEAALRSYPGCRQFRRPRGRGSRTGNAGRGRGERVSGRSWSKAEQDGGVGLRLA